MPFTHSEEGSRIGVVQYEPYVLGLAAVIVSIAYGRHDAEASIRSILYKRGAWVSEPRGVIDDVLICATYDDRRQWRLNSMEEWWW